ncbi:hypothetical protein AALB39_26135 [Lachnospiraceae bacterium 54-53]
MLRELWALIRIEYMIIREMNLRLKLLKHQGKMVDTFVDIDKEFTGKQFQIDSVQTELDQLEDRIKSRFGQ